MQERRESLEDLSPAVSLTVRVNFTLTSLCASVSLLEKLKRRNYW